MSRPLPAPLGASKSAKSPTIGALARAAGVHVETVRYYERLGLLVAPPRRPGGVRRYGEQALKQLRFIKRAQALGFSLSEVRVLLRLSGEGSCAEARAFAAMKLELLEKDLAKLQAVRDTLRALVEACDRPGALPGCALLETLSNEIDASA